MKEVDIIDVILRALRGPEPTIAVRVRTKFIEQIDDNCARLCDDQTVMFNDRTFAEGVDRFQLRRGATGFCMGKPLSSPGLAVIPGLPVVVPQVIIILIVPVRHGRKLDARHHPLSSVDA